MKKRAMIALLAGTAIVVSLAGCVGGSGGSGSSSAGGGKGRLVGVALPTKASERWVADGDSLKQQLQAAGYKVDLEYGAGDIPTQVSQIENMVTHHAAALIVAAIDGTTLTSVLENAARDHIAVVAYDTLLRDTTAVSYYATFDSQLTGSMQAWSLLNGLGLTDLTGKPLPGAPAGPFNIELFAGPQGDGSAFFFFNGAMNVLQPYIDKGTLVVGSGQTDIATAATAGWDGATAQTRMKDILASTYSGEKRVHAVLSPSDGISRGISAALTGAGFTAGKDFPILSGRDAQLDSVKAIVHGEQYATIFEDTRRLATKAVKMTTAVLAGSKPEVNNTEDYDNGKKVVPAYLLQPVIVVKDNIESTLVKSGYYTDATING